MGSRFVCRAAMLFLLALTGCGGTHAPQPVPRPIASGTIERLTVWTNPVQRPGETGSNTGYSPPKGSRVEVYDEFILITPPEGPTILSPHGWYTELSFNRDSRH
jgi:hypothetical protein